MPVDLNPNNVVLESARLLMEAKKKSQGILVSYSGGKDSLVVLDLCAKAGFNPIVCFHMYFVPGLEIVEKQMRFARERYAVEILEYPHPNLGTFLKNGDYSDITEKTDKIELWDIADIHASVREDTSINLIATGHKSTDAIGGALANKKAAKSEGEIHPITKWNKFHVLGHLEANNIPIPENDGRNSASIGLHPKCLCWLWENHREDFERIRKVFPYIEAAPARKQFHGIPKN